MKIGKWKYSSLKNFVWQLDLASMKKKKLLNVFKPLPNVFAAFPLLWRGAPKLVRFGKGFRIGLLSLFTFHLSPTSAQPLSAYVNQDGRFFVFDNFEVDQADYLQPIAYKIGRTCIPFIANTKNFRVYYNGKVNELNDGFTSDCYVSNDLMYFKNNATLYVFDNGKITKLADYNSSFAFGDSLIGYTDDRAYTYNIYYSGKVTELAQNSLENPMKMTAAGSNIFAFVDQYDQFRIFYHEEIIEQEDRKPQMIQAGKDLVIYRDNYGDLKIFYSGETYDMGQAASSSLKVSFWAGNEMAAFIDTDGELKIFYKGKLIETGVRNPQFIKMKDNMLVYDDRAGGFSVFYNGVETHLENFIPVKIELSQSSMYYFTQSNEIRFYTFGKMVELPIQTYDDIHLDYDVLQVKTGFNQFSFYYQDKKL